MATICDDYKLPRGSQAGVGTFPSVTLWERGALPQLINISRKGQAGVPDSQATWQTRPRVAEPRDI